MQSARLDRRVTVQQRVLTRDTYGSEIESWTERCVVWGQRLDTTGREYFTAAERRAEGTAKFRLRYRDDLEVTDRLVCEGVTYDIQNIAELGRREGLEIVAVVRS